MRTAPYHKKGVAWMSLIFRCNVLNFEEKGSLMKVWSTARSEVDKENEDRALSPEGSGMDVLNL